jgi:hypothetical protein
LRCELKRAIVGDMDFRSDVVVLASKSQVSCMITSSLGLGLSEFGEADVWLLHKFLLCSNHVKRNELSPISTSICLKKERSKNTNVRICSLGDQYFLVVVYDIVRSLLFMDSIEHVLIANLISNLACDCLIYHGDVKIQLA